MTRTSASSLETVTPESHFPRIMVQVQTVCSVVILLPFPSRLTELVQSKYPQENKTRNKSLADMMIIIIIILHTFVTILNTLKYVLQ